MKSFRKNSLPKKPMKTLEGRTNLGKDPQCYECKGHGHLTIDCANKQCNKAMAAMWDEESDESDVESMSSDDESSQSVKAFTSFVERLL